jgi:DNA-binding response OmpR family regulator
MMSRILVADDDDELRRRIELILTADGYDVQTAAYGQEALDLYAPDRFDLLCLDLSMPLVDGIEVTQAVRSRPDDVPILMITGSGSTRKLAAAREAGISDVLSKPFRTSELRARIRALLAGGAARGRGTGAPPDAALGYSI